MSKSDNRGKNRWWNLSSWSFSAHERRAIWLLTALILIGSAVRFHRNRRLARKVDVWVETARNTSDSLAKTSSLPVPSSPIDINTASQAELEKLPGIGPVRATAIITYRDTHGHFRNIDDIVKVKGIGEKTLEQMRKLAVVRPDSSNRR